MIYKKSEFYFILALLVGISILTFLIFKPFLYTFFLAVIFATVFAPVHKKMLTLAHNKRGLAALLTTALILIVIVVPITFLGTQIFKEGTALYVSLIDNGEAVSFLHGVEDVLRGLGTPFASTDPLDFGQYMKQGLSWMIQHLGVIFSNVARIAAGIFILLIALYYLLKEGPVLKKFVVAMSPLQDAHDEIIFRKLSLAINSVVRGSILVGLTQGVLAAIGLAIFGVPNPVLWGSVAAITSLIPGVGTALVLVPSILFLLFVGETTSAVGLLVWGILAVGLVDNVLGPKLTSRGVQIHPFLILLSILGGISLFGPIGFLFGPLTLSLLFVFLEIYALIRKGQNV